MFEKFAGNKSMNNWMSLDAHGEADRISDQKKWLRRDQSDLIGNLWPDFVDLSQIQKSFRCSLAVK